MSDVKKTKKEWQTELEEKLKQNHIWLNAFACVHPTDKFKMQLAEDILHRLNDKSYLMEDDTCTSDSKPIREISKLTPMLFLRINKS